VTIEERLAAAAAAVRERNAVDSQLADVRRRIDAARDQVAGLSGQLAEEERDVERLESLSFARVLAALRGSAAEDLDRERAERDAAAYRLREAEYRLTNLFRESRRLDHQRGELAAAHDEWKAALAQKEAYLAERGVPESAEVFGIAQERGEVLAERREVAEAVTAAADAGAALDEVASQLASASSWSTYDTFFGGGAISSAVKHDRIDAAQRAASRAETRLAILARELRDVGAGGPVAPALRIDSITSLADIFFDNIFTDWAVDSRISDAKESVARARRAVREVAARLAAREQRLALRSAELAQRRVDLLHGRP
jgi:DNA repair exonuclease SbcCD ATPase subunit